MAKKIVRHELIELVIPGGSTSTRFSLQDYPNLRNTHIWGIQLYTRDSVPVGIQSQAPVITNTNFKKGFLTFVNYGGKEFLKQSPLTIFQTITSPLSTDTMHYDTDIKSFVGQKVNYPKSYFEFSTTPGEVADTCIMMSVYYSLPLSEEKLEDDFSFGNRS